MDGGLILQALEAAVAGGNPRAQESIGVIKDIVAIETAGPSAEVDIPGTLADLLPYLKVYRFMRLHAWAPYVAVGLLISGVIGLGILVGRRIS